MEFSRIQDPKDRRRLLELLRKSGYVIADIDAHLTADPDIVLAAVSDNPMAVSFANKDLLDDSKFALEAVLRHWRALEFLPHKHREQLEIVRAAARRNSLALNFASPSILHEVGDLRLPEEAGYNGEYVRLVGHFNEWRTTDSDMRFKQMSSDMATTIAAMGNTETIRNLAEWHQLTVCLETGSASFQIISCTRNFDFRIFPAEPGTDGFFRLLPGDVDGMCVRSGGKKSGHGHNFLIEEEPNTVVTIFAGVPKGFGGLSAHGKACVWYTAECKTQGELDDQHNVPVLTQESTRQKPKKLKSAKVKISDESIEIDKARILADIDETPSLKNLVFQARKISEHMFSQRFRIRDLHDGRHLTVLVDTGCKHVLGFVCYWISPIKTFQLENIAMRKRCQRMGLGQRLMDWSLSQAKRTGCSVVQAVALKSAVGFYERLGFCISSSSGSKETAVEVEFRL